MFKSRYLPGFLLGLLAAVAAPACAAEGALDGDTSEEGAREEVTESVSSAIIGAGTTPGSLTEIPFYFAVPKHALGGTLEVERKGYPWSTVWSPANGNPNVGLRMISIPETGLSARLEMSEKLGKTGVIQDGDVVLSFRTKLADTVAYPHIQMGSTHAGLAFLDEDGGPAHNLDQPLDTDYNKISGGRFVGRFDAKHYVGASDSTDALHILRPRWTPEQRAVRAPNLRKWVELLGKNHAGIRAAGGLNFNSDYLKPLLASGASPAKIATEFGHVMLRKIQPRQDFDMFCSELAFHMLALANCTTDEIANTPAGGEAACAASGLPFRPMKLVGDANNTPGLAEGPLLGLLHSGGEVPANALERIFPGPNANGASLSAGHRAVAEATKPLMSGLQAYYTARLARSPQADAIAAQLNASTGNVANYSPTAFLVDAMTPDASERGMDYIATVVFTDAAANNRAKSLAKPGPVPAP